MIVLLLKPKWCRQKPAPLRLAQEPHEGCVLLPAARAVGALCLTVPLKTFADATGRAAADVEKMDADVIAGIDCVGVDTPSGLDFVIAAALRKDETGADYTKDVRLPLPSAVVGGSSISLATGTTLLVAKVSRFREANTLRFVNVATVREEGGKRFIETLPASARAQMSGAMKVDGPGLYAFYVSRQPVGFVSGTVTKGGAPVAGAVAIGTTAPFLMVADGAGTYTLPLARGNAGLAAYELSTRATGEAFLPIEEGGKTNPKTNKPVETPGKDTPLPGLSAVNLTGVEIALQDPPVLAPGPGDFESGTFEPWKAEGDTAVLSTEASVLFPASTKKNYAFLSTGDGSRRGIASRMVREVNVPAGTRALVIDYNVMTQEYPNWVGTIYNDVFVAYVSGDRGFLLAETVTGNAGKWTDFGKVVGNVDKSSVESGKFNGITGARQKRIALDGCEGKRITLVLGVSDVGDSIYDTAVAVQRVAFE